MAGTPAKGASHLDLALRRGLSHMSNLAPRSFLHPDSCAIEALLSRASLADVAARIIALGDVPMIQIDLSKFACATCRDAGVFPCEGEWASCLCEAGRLRCTQGSDCPD
jgi:hypothetical protein